ncbi:MAG: methionyl-tRNA formyltransferase [Nitrospirota bacterium]
MKLIFFGTPEFALPTLKILLNSKHEVLAVVTQPDRQSGRGRRITSCPVKLEAQKAGLKVFQPLRVKDGEFIEELKKMNPSVAVVVAYGQILPPEIIHLPEFGCINVHASLLPKYRGAAPINWAVINGDKKTGVTTMLMDEGLDTGHVLIQEVTEINAEDTAGDLSIKLSRIGADILTRTLESMEKGDLKPVPQSGEATYARLLKKSDGLIKWSKSSEELSNLIKGVNPWPGAYSFFEGEKIKILKAISVDGKMETGVVCKKTKNELIVGAGIGMLSILEVQPSGKPAMAIKSFLQGRKIIEGSRFDENSVG